SPLARPVLPRTFYFMALRYGLGTATPLVARPKAELQNERRRFWDERHGLPLIVAARPTGARSSDA
ncbi:MAG: hypothetical protein MSA17_03790, partial [Collinsella sp.]|nr:hypothetical protein [Collinsella sp.]MDD6997568.1 hypothetical protein [Collinsella sp.]